MRNGLQNIPFLVDFECILCIFIVFLAYFWKMLLLALFLKFLQENVFALNLSPTIQTKVGITASTPIGILKEFVILNILLPFELWMYFQFLLHSNYRMIRDLSSHHDVCHYNVQPR